MRPEEHLNFIEITRAPNQACICFCCHCDCQPNGLMHQHLDFLPLNSLNISQLLDMFWRSLIQSWSTHNHSTTIPQPFHKPYVALCKGFPNHDCPKSAPDIGISICSSHGLGWTRSTPVPWRPMARRQGTCRSIRGIIGPCLLRSAWSGTWSGLGSAGSKRQDPQNWNASEEKWYIII